MSEVFMSSLVNKELAPRAVAASKAVKFFGNSGRMVGGSKTIYRDEHPDDLVIFNANLATKEDGKIWYGDINLSEDLEKLVALAKKLGRRIYVIREIDARFEKEPIVDGDYEAYKTNEWCQRYQLTEDAFYKKRDEIFEDASFSTDGESNLCRDTDYQLVEGRLTFAPDLSALGITKRLRFKDIDVFDSKPKKKGSRKPAESPLHLISKFVCKQLGIKLKDGEQIDSSQLVMTQQDIEILMYLCRRWIKANFRVHPARLDSEIGWLTFSSPCTHRNDEKHYLESGYIYVKDQSQLVVVRQKD
jgi:hypothetical protein